MSALLGFLFLCACAASQALPARHASRPAKAEQSAPASPSPEQAAPAPSGAPTAVAIDPELIAASARIQSDIEWLADPARQGRGLGSPGLEAAGAFIEKRVRSLGLEGAAGPQHAYREAFPVVTKIEREPTTRVTVDGVTLKPDAFAVLGYSPTHVDVTGPIVFAGYGIVAPALGVDDYAGLDARKKIVLVRRFAPESGAFASSEAQRTQGDIRKKAFLAREHGARALLIVDDPEPPAPASTPAAPSAAQQTPEAKLPALEPEGYADAGLAVIVVKREFGHAWIERARGGAQLRARLRVHLKRETTRAFNVVAMLHATPRDGAALPGAVIIGAHYDHLGLGGRYSLAPGIDTPHPGADDNASGVATVLEVARMLHPRIAELRRDVLIVAFSGEEAGLLGSSHFVTARKPKGKEKPEIVAMLNLDMVGRMRDRHLEVLGVESAEQWPSMVTDACARERLDCSASGDGYGPSDHMSFYTAGVPVLHFFTGVHSDYHKPSDTPDKINAEGAATVAQLCTDLIVKLATDPAAPVYRDAPRAKPATGDLRHSGAALGTLPDYAGPGPGKSGVLLAGVRKGSAAEKAGMRAGDILIRLGRTPIGSVEDFMFVLSASRPGESVPVVVIREGHEVTLEATFETSR